jgi:hypothetical protein
VQGLYRREALCRRAVACKGCTGMGDLGDLGEPLRARAVHGEALRRESV